MGILNDNADRHFSEKFVNTFYIGRHQIHPPDSGKKPHRFYYIGYRDLFGVLMPEARGSFSSQLWGPHWVFGRSKKLDKALHQAMKGKFPDVRHNTQLRARADSHGQLFTKPTWHGKAPPTVKKTAEVLPIRGRRIPIRGRRKNRRRKLLV